jgi:hypothetical protein
MNFLHIIEFTYNRKKNYIKIQNFFKINEIKFLKLKFFEYFH